MKGYCESCSSEQYGVKDEYDVNVCTACETDLVIGVHVEEEYEEDYDGFDAFLQKD
jgi:hypothetical protein